MGIEIMLKSKSVRCSNGYVTRTAVCAFHDLFLSRYHNPFQSFSNESNPSNNSNNLGSENLKDKASDAGYKSIGSFHGDNIEHRMSLSDEEYENFVPELPFDSKIEQIVSSNNPNVNRTLCWNDAFLLDRETWTFLNHGAFGAALSCGHIRANQWRDFQEEQPLRFFDRHLLPHLAHSNRVLAKFTGSKSPESTVLIPNVTSGMNTILSGYARNHVDRPIIFFDVAYGSVKKMISCYCGVENVFEIKLSTLPSPLSQETIEKVFIQSLDKIKSKCKGNVSGGILVLDHITSNTAMLLPVERLAAIAKEEGLLVAVDGAHGLFSVDLNMQHLTESGVDFYVSNTHKWLSCPRGAAFLYCSDKVLQESILRKPAIVSHGINDGFLSRFIWDGCRDFGAALAIPSVIDFWETNNVSSIRHLLGKNLDDAVNILASSWHKGKDPTDYLYAALDLRPPTMTLVRLPDSLSGNDEVKSSIQAKAVQDFLYSNHIEVPIKCIDGRLYVRISCHVYNNTEDYEKLANILKNAK